MTIDLSGNPKSVGGVIGRIVGGIVLIIVGVALALGSLAAAVGSVFYEPLLDWSDLIADAAYFLVPLGIVLVIVGAALIVRGVRRKAMNLEPLAEFLGAENLAGFDAENPNRIPPPGARPTAGQGDSPPPKTLI